MHTLRFSCFHHLLSFTLVTLMCFAAAASAQTVINTVPYTITNPGKYILNGNLSNANGNVPAITVDAPNVILDLNGYFVAGPGDTSLGFYHNAVIYVNEVANVTVRNGTLAGCGFGIVHSANTAANSRNYVLDSVVVTRCYIAGVFFAGTTAPGSLVKNCSFSTIGKSTSSANSYAYAILSQGGVRIEGNNIGDVTATGTGSSYGIYCGASDFTIGNTLANCGTGIAHGKYLKNLTSNVATPFSNGSNATGNN